MVQPQDNVSPPKWHLAHTTWFFEEFILKKYLRGYRVFRKSYSKLFNSYYESVGSYWPQSKRGCLSRPTVREILSYRKYVDQHMGIILRTLPSVSDIGYLLEVGLNHEQQHQELLVMDIKYILGMNPLAPAYSNDILGPIKQSPSGWCEFKEGVYEVGFDDQGFAYDNEKPLHRTYLNNFGVRRNLVSNGEYLKFMKSNAYDNVQLWLSDGYNWVKENQIRAPLYWRLIDGEWFEYKLSGLAPVDLRLPVSHISYYEAQAFAKWSGHRLPSESELEVALGNEISPLWSWTASSYSAYPGYRPYLGKLGEYNSKFMCNQFVLRGGCQATPKEHYRRTYRNFYLPHQRWMFSGIRIAKDI